MSDDLISRQAETCDYWDSESNYCALNKPSVQERKVGKWIDPAAENVYRCSVCEDYTTLEVPRLFYHYCPNCGAEMKGEDDDEKRS